MKFDLNSIRLQIILPILMVSIVMFTSIFVVTKGFVDGVVKEYRSLFVSKHSFEIRKILERAITELSVTQLIGHHVVLSAKKADVIEEIKLYWAQNHFEGLITEEDTVLLNHLKTLSPAGLKQIFSDESVVFIEAGNSGLIGFVVSFPAWNWQIYTIAKPEISQSERQIKLLLPFTVLAYTLLVVIVFFVIHRRLNNSIGCILKDIKASSPIATTGITEIDTIGQAINESFTKLQRQTAQYLALHNIALSLYKESSINDTLELILDQITPLINAKYSAVVLFDERNRVSYVVSNNLPAQVENTLLNSRFLDLIRYSANPIVANETSKDSILKYLRDEDTQSVQNLLTYPFFSTDNRLYGVMCFLNKEGGFTEEDSSLLKAVSADLSTAIIKADAICQLSRFKQIIDISFEMIIITDHEGYFKYVNPAFERITGYSSNEVIGRKTNILKSGLHDDDFYKKLWETISSGDIWQGEFVNKKKDGELFYTSAVIFPIFFENELSYVSIQRDTTQEKKLYEQLLRSQKMEAIGTLAGGIAHDFNNILTAILGYSEILLSMVDMTDRSYKPVKVIHDSAKRASELTKKLLTITRHEKKEVKPVNLNNIVADVVDIISHSLPKNIEIVTQLDKTIPPISADPSQIHQMILNLAVNAKDAMPDGGVLTISTSVCGSPNDTCNDGLTQDGKFVKLTVSDTGVGIDKKLQQKVFDPFFTTKAQGKGTGLGLYIVHSIVTNHNGYINLYSEPNKGTRFNIYLPVSPAVQKEVETPHTLLSSGGTVLVIDDEEDVRAVCADMLTHMGFDVLVASDGKEGIQQYIQNKEKIDFVILDMIMPKMGGNEVFATLKEINPDVKVIICSGFSNEGYAGIDRLLKAGAVAFLQKPYTQASLVEALKKAQTKDTT